MYQHGQSGATPPPPFLSVSLGAHPKWRRNTPPPQKGYLSDTCAIPHENKAKWVGYPLCDTTSKGYCRIRGGGVSRTGPLSWYSVQTPFVMLLFQMLRAFGKGVSEKPQNPEGPTIKTIQSRSKCLIISISASRIPHKK